MRIPIPLAALAAAIALAGCTSHHVTIDPVVVELKPVKIDVNLKIDRELQEYFKDADEAAKEDEPEPGAATPKTKN